MSRESLTLDEARAILRSIEQGECCSTHLLWAFHGVLEWIFLSMCVRNPTTEVNAVTPSPSTTSAHRLRHSGELGECLRLFHGVCCLCMHFFVRPLCFAFPLPQLHSLLLLLLLTFLVRGTSCCSCVQWGCVFLGVFLVHRVPHREPRSEIHCCGKTHCGRLSGCCCCCCCCCLCCCCKGNETEQTHHIMGLILCVFRMHAHVHMCVFLGQVLQDLPLLPDDGERLQHHPQVQEATMFMMNSPGGFPCLC